MTFRDLLVDTLRTLWAHKLRTGLTMFGIAWGIVSITLMVAAGEGFAAGPAAKVAEKFGKNIMIVNAGRTSLQAGGMRSGRLIRWNADDYKVVAARRHGLRVRPAGAGQQSHGQERLQQRAPAWWSVRCLRSPTSAPSTSPKGRFYKIGATSNAPSRVAVLGSDLYEQLYRRARRRSGERILIKGIPYRVIGCDAGRRTRTRATTARTSSKVFIPFTSMLRDFPNT